MTFRQHSFIAAFALAAALSAASPRACAQQGPATVYNASPTPPAQAASPTPTQAPSAANPEFQFEVASIKPSKAGGMGARLMPTADGFSADNIPVAVLITFAYGLTDNNQLSGKPGWLDSERYDIQARLDPAVAEAVRKMDRDHAQLARQQMLQALLADRFGLKIHRETKELPIYLLEIGKNGPKLTPTTLPPLPPPGSPESKDAKAGPPPPPPPAPGPGAGGKFQMPKGFRGSMMNVNSRGEISMSSNGVTTTMLATVLSRMLHRQVTDKTGLTGEYDFNLQYASDVLAAAPAPPSTAGPSPAATPAPPSAPEPGPSIFAALQEQLGLKLESTKGPVEIIVIDQISRPSEN